MLPWQLALVGLVMILGGGASGVLLLRWGYRAMGDEERRDRGVAQFLGGVSMIFMAIVGAGISVDALRIIERIEDRAMIREAMTNVIGISAEIERFHADGNFSYTTGHAQRGCPGSALYTSNGTAVGILPIAIQGESYQYRVESWDTDGDGSCERYRVTAEPVQPPALRSGPLSYDQNGTKKGPWR